MAPRTAALIGALAVVAVAGVASAQTSLFGLNVEGDVELGRPGLHRQAVGAGAGQARGVPGPGRAAVRRLPAPAAPRRTRPTRSGLSGLNVGQEDQEFALGVARPGLFTGEFEWNQIPHLYSTTGRLLATRPDGQHLRAPHAAPAAGDVQRGAAARRDQPALGRRALLLHADADAGHRHPARVHPDQEGRRRADGASASGARAATSSRCWSRSTRPSTTSARRARGSGRAGRLRPTTRSRSSTTSSRVLRPTTRASGSRPCGGDACRPGDRAVGGAARQHGPHLRRRRRRQPADADPRDRQRLLQPPAPGRGLPAPHDQPDHQLTRSSRCRSRAWTAWSGSSSST